MIGIIAGSAFEPAGFAPCGSLPRATSCRPWARVHYRVDATWLRQACALRAALGGTGSLRGRAGVKAAELPRGHAPCAGARGQSP